VHNDMPAPRKRPRDGVRPESARDSG
jgi:hypothetical protein